MCTSANGSDKVSNGGPFESAARAMISASSGARRARVAIEESRQLGAVEIAQHRAPGRVRLAQPLDPAERLVAPARRVQTDQLEDGGARHRGRRAGELVALRGGREILQQQREVRSLAVDRGVVAARRRDGEAGLQLAVERHLLQEVPQRDAGGAAGRIIGRELADHAARRPRIIAGEAKRETDALADLTRADAGGGEVADLGGRVIHLHEAVR